MAKSSKRPLVVFPINKLKKIGNFILRVRTIGLNIKNNASIFVTPLPLPLTVTTDVDALEAAQAKAQTRVTGSAAARDLQYDVVLRDVHNWEGYVQGLADDSADEAAAIAVINASGFDLKNRGVRVKAPLAVKQLVNTDVLVLTAKADGKRASYLWAQSTDGIVWTDLPATLQAKTTVNGITPGTKVFFRVRVVLKNGSTTWRAAVSIIVV